jgi:esterase/lipase superfamily enzyme
MNKQSIEWNSPSLGKKISLDVYGSGGTPILFLDGFPQYFTQLERKNVLSGIRLQIESEFNQVFCLSMPTESDIMNMVADAAGRLISYNFFEEFILDEVTPRIKKDSGYDFLIIVGVGNGAYHALNLMLKHPDRFNKLISVCGPVDLRDYFGDFFSQNLYYNNPIEFLPNLNDYSIIDKINTNDLRIVTSSIDVNKDKMIKMSEMLSFKNIDHVLDVWGEDWTITSETWAEMLKKHVP